MSQAPAPLLLLGHSQPDRHRLVLLLTSSLLLLSFLLLSIERQLIYHKIHILRKYTVRVPEPSRGTQLSTADPRSPSSPKEKSCPFALTSDFPSLSGIKGILDQPVFPVLLHIYLWVEFLGSSVTLSFFFLRTDQFPPAPNRALMSPQCCLQCLVGIKCYPVIYMKMTTK